MKQLWLRSARPLWSRPIWGSFGSLALALTLGLPTYAQAQDGPGVMGPVLEVADDEADMKELEARLNEILVVDESGELVLREEFKGSLPFPPERVERMLGAFVELTEDGKIKLKNKEMVRPYLPMMKRFLSQGGMDKLKELQKLPAEERREAMQRLMGEAQGQEEQQPEEKPAKKAESKPAKKAESKPAKKAESKSDEAPRRERRVEERRERRVEEREEPRRRSTTSRRPSDDELHQDVMGRLERIENSLRRIERYLQEMERAHGGMERRDDRGGRSRDQGRRGFDPERMRDMLEQFGRGRGRDGFDMERMRDMLEQFGRGRGEDRSEGRRSEGRRSEGRRDEGRRSEGRRSEGRRSEGRRDEGRRGFNPERLRDMMQQFGGGEGFDPERLRDMMKQFGGGEGFDPERLRDMMEQFGGGEGFDPERMRGMLKQFGGGEGGERMGNVQRGIAKLMEIMDEDDKRALKKALGALAKDFDPSSLQNPDQLLGKLGENLSPEEMSRLMEVFSEFAATEEGRALQEEIEGLMSGGEGLMNSPEGERLLGILRQLEGSLGQGKGGKLGEQLEGLMRGRDKGRARGEGRAREGRARGEGREHGAEGHGEARPGQVHPKNPKARLY